MTLPITVALPQSFAPYPGLTILNKGNHVLARQKRAIPSLRRSSPLTVKCSEISRNDFPPYFKFGAGSSAIQTESCALGGGRGRSTGDEFVGYLPAIKSLSKYKEDVKCLSYMNLDVYRFSISWSRIFPTGKWSDGPNPLGVEFYNNLINELKSNNIEPFVTLFHFDLPYALQEKYNGFLSSEFIDDFNDYADFCFQTFGDRVKHWTTFNEPHIYLCNFCGDELKKDPYKAAHNLLLAHAAAVTTYRDRYQSTQNGYIGMTMEILGYYPLTDSPADFTAVSRAWDFNIGWFLDPMVTGDYPFSMRCICGDRLPQFTPKEKELVMGSYDFVGINYYTSRYVKSLPFPPSGEPSYDNDMCMELLVEKDGILIGAAPDMNNYGYSYPQGLYDILMKLKSNYSNPTVYITENGCPQKRDFYIPMEVTLQDDLRIDWIKGHLGAVSKALSEQANVKGYFHWSLLDNVEFQNAYTCGYGLCYVDICDDFKRVPKKSATWFKDFLATRPRVLPTLLRPTMDLTFHANSSF